MARVKSYNKRRRRYAAPIGAGFALLALVGLIMVVIGSIRLTASVLDNTGERLRIEHTIRPIVMFDPAPFERAVDIDEVQLLFYSVWSALINNDYSYNERNELLVPASDLNVQARAMFGPDITLHHRSFGEFEYTFYFDEERQVYIVPTQILLYTYSPRVIYIEQVGDLFHALVGYVPPVGTSPLSIRHHTDPDPEKYMIYVLRRTGQSYQVVAVRDVAEGETHAGIGIPFES